MRETRRLVGSSISRRHGNENAEPCLIVDEKIDKLSQVRQSGITPGERNIK